MFFDYFTIMLNMIKDNIFWVKDAFTIVFSLVITTIAILTYRRAKEAFLQPVRSEVIKRQADILIKLLPTITELNRSIDYRGLIHLNALYWFLRYGFIFSKDDDKKYVKEKSVGSIFIPDVDGRIDVVRIDAFGGKVDDEAHSFDEGKKMYEEAKKGHVTINEIRLTKEFAKTEKEIRHFIDNPLIPGAIKDSLEELVEEMRINAKEHVATTIDWAIQEMIKRDNKGIISLDGFFNKFNSRRIHHESTLEKIRSKVRGYLKVDSVPWVE